MPFFFFFLSFVLFFFFPPGAFAGPRNALIAFSGKVTKWKTRWACAQHTMPEERGTVDFILSYS